jgi:serine/threonine-protein kinase
MQSRYSTILLALLYAGFLGHWSWSGGHLPDRVATHFNGGGEPNGWMSRDSHQTFMLIFGLSFPLLVPGLINLSRWFPRGLNIPHKEYWLAPERKAETFSYLARHSLWFACLAIFFVTGLQHSIVQANRQIPVHLSASFILVAIGPFLAGTALWAVRLLMHFRKP